MQERFFFMQNLIECANRAVWGAPLIVAISAIGIGFMVSLRWLPVRKLPLAMKLLFTAPGEKTPGTVSAFGALTTSLAAMIGTGNIVGVATAVSAGGPGSIVWMVIAAFFGMPLTYAEGLLAVKYRERARDGSFLGGAFLYIERGMGRKFKFLAKAFALFGALAALLGIGTMAQVNSLTAAVVDIVNGKQTALICAVVVTILVSRVIFGGIQTISRVSQILVPVMGGLYLVSTVLVLITFRDRLPESIVQMLSCAFSGNAVWGGFSGALVASAVRMGVSRGIFSNEAGMGSGSIAAAASRTKSPVEQGLICMLGPFIDTILLCTLTGLAIVVSRVSDVGLTGVSLTAQAYAAGFPFAPWLGKGIVSVALICFAFTTVLGWNYYGEQCVTYLCGGKRIFAYRVLYLFAVFFGCLMELSMVWNIADILNGLMAIPNLIALVCLFPVVAWETRRYFFNKKQT